MLLEEVEDVVFRLAIGVDVQRVKVAALGVSGIN